MAIRATLEYYLEYDPNEVYGDPKELLLELLAAEGDDYLRSLIKVENV